MNVAKRNYIPPESLVVYMISESPILATSLNANDRQYQTPSDDSSTSGCGDQLSNRYSGWNSDQWSDD